MPSFHPHSSRQSLSPDRSLALSERIAYGCGDTACNVVFGMVNTLLTLFYTDYIGISVATVGVVLLVSRVLDGIFSLLMGVLAGHTQTRWGRTRPWILWASVPYCITAVAMFTVPQTESSLQFWYIFLTYNLCTTLFYNMINVPYGTLGTLMTRSPKERDMLSIFRSAMAPVGRILSVTLTMPVVKLFGDTPDAWVKAMTMWSIIGFVLLLICFFRCKETVPVPPSPTAKPSSGAGLRALITNQYFWAVLLLWTVTCVHITLVGTSLPYYCKYLLNNDSWMYSALYLAETITLIVGALCCPLLLRRFDKRTISLAGCLFAVVAHALLVLHPTSFPLTMATMILRALGQVPLTAVIYSMVGDAIEFGHWKSNLRQEALIIGACTLGYKVGTGICSAVISHLMSLSGYISSSAATVVQPASALMMIRLIYLIGPLLIWGFAALILAFYKLDKQVPRIIAELRARETASQ